MLSRTRISLANNRQKTSMMMVNKPIATKDTKKAFFKSFSFCEPYNIENSTPLPIHKPRIIDVKKTISVKEEPTAANASEPKYLPTISVSAILYNCCKRLPKIIGKENSHNDFVTEPSNNEISFKLITPIDDIISRHCPNVNTKFLCIYLFF